MVTPLMPECKSKTSLAHNVSRIRLRKGNIIQDRLCTCNVILEAFVQPLLQWKSDKYCMFGESVCILRYPTCKAHEPHCHPWTVRL